MTEAELLQLIEQAAEEGWTELDLAKKTLNSLPLQIGQLQNLTELDLSFNQLSTLPAEIGQLQNLIKLYVSSNRLKNTNQPILPISL
jgi:Leucine-rich repeat (LRR) protein